MKKELFLEEAVLDDLNKDLEHLGQPLSHKTFKFLGGTIFFLGTLVIIRVIFISFINGDFYKERALFNSAHLSINRAERGILFDKFNNQLVDNVPTFKISIKLVEFLKNEEIREKTSKTLEEILGLEPGYIKELTKNINLERQNILTLSKELSIDEAVRIKSLNIDAVRIENDFKRNYKDPEIFSHIVGYTGFVDKNDLKENADLYFNESIGKGGIEYSYDKELRGENGETVNYRNSKGETIETKILKNPKPGYSIKTTIDADLQKYFYERLKQRLDFLGSSAGAGIIMNPDSGEILSLVSIPGFNNNKIEPSDLINKNKPFFNRAISGVYAPGSTIKPLVAVAALKENVITPEEEIFSKGYIEIPNPYFPDKPSRFVDWKPHGWVNLYSAIAKSSNIYFYEVGGGYGNQKGLGVEKLKNYWGKFGLGYKTGIDLPYEANGFLPDPSSKEKSGGIWRIGDTYNVSIGQGDLLITPIQLINYVSLIANGGKIYKPFVVNKIIDDKENTVKENKPEILKDYSSELKEIIKIIEEGMIDVVKKPYGTAYSLFDLPFTVAAKTGTAQIEGNAKTNAFFVGYGPVNSEDKKIAILVLVENARAGSLNTIPVAKDVLRWYYENRIVKTL